MSAGNVAVMTSPKADVNWCRFGACRHVEAREESTRHVEAREEVRRRVEVHGVREVLTQNLWAARGAPVTSRLSLTCRSAEDDLSDTSRNEIGVI